jgi:hypothetical protein
MIVVGSQANLFLSAALRKQRLGLTARTGLGRLGRAQQANSTTRAAAAGGGGGGGGGPWRPARRAAASLPLSVQETNDANVRNMLEVIKSPGWEPIVVDRRGPHPIRVWQKKLGVGAHHGSAAMADDRAAAKFKCIKATALIRAPPRQVYALFLDNERVCLGRVKRTRRWWLHFGFALGCPRCFTLSRVVGRLSGVTHVMRWSP